MSSHPPATLLPIAREGDAPVPAIGFSARLRDATKLVHREAERTGFIADLIRGRATRTSYFRFLCNLVPAYSMLETCLAAQPEGSLANAFTQHGLPRLPSLLADIEAIGAAGLAPCEKVLPEATAYAAAIEAAAAGDGLALVAHAYARYLGDLSGGQILKPIIARSLDLEPGMLRFYDFPQIADTDVAKQRMREALDTVEPTGADADRIIQEATAAFRHNIALSLAVSRALEPTG